MGSVVAVHRSAIHSFSKLSQPSIQLIAGFGVAGDAHAGRTVKHRSRVRRDPTQPNLRQVHLIHAELFTELRSQGFDIVPGQLGENITTEGVDLLGLPTGTRLRLGSDAIVEVTGLRNPCVQLNGIADGLMGALIFRDDDGHTVRKAGVMGVVLADGVVRPDDPITVSLPAEPHQPLKPV